MKFWGLNQSMPVYVTRETGNGVIASYSLSAWMTLLAIALIWLNVVIWSAIGLYEAVRIFV